MDRPVLQFLKALVPSPLQSLQDRGLTATVDAVQTEQTVPPVRTRHLDDGFLTPRVRPRSHKQSFGTNSNCSYGDTHIVEVHGVCRQRACPPPLSPRVTVAGRWLEARDPGGEGGEGGEEVEGEGCSSEEAGSQYSLDVGEQYPQFRCKSMSVKQPRDCPRKTSTSPSCCRTSDASCCPFKTSSSLQVDDVTTLHAMLGDERHEAGTCRALRSVRVRYPTY